MPKLSMPKIFKTDKDNVTKINQKSVVFKDGRKIKVKMVVDNFSTFIIFR